ncbi:hypothetical protein [Brachybacterium sp. YJGR34]|uniref:hypothetical protein n=1 Tax=Brachybacterium sp. YJGR34 TaxID=2059911 RepID=UPI0018E5AFCE|nr:hypothetical protein [Brachybacterium sp. YJGR34]
MSTQPGPRRRHGAGTAAYRARRSARAAPQRGVPREHPARRAERIFGYGALTGLALLVLSIPLGIIAHRTPAGLDSLWFLVPLGVGMVLTGLGWVLWGSWSATLDRYTAPLSTTALLTLAATTAIVLSLVCFGAAGAPLLLYTETDPPDALFPVVIGLGGLGVLLFVVTILGAAIYGGIALGGPRWWWVGVLLTIGLFATSIGWVDGRPLVTAAGVVALVGSIPGYWGALRSGLAQGRADAIEADDHRRGGGR